MYEQVYFVDSLRVAPTTASVHRSAQRAFGARVRELRVLAGLTQEDLAERCGLFRTYMSRIETGKANPTLTLIHALATSLRVPAKALLDTGPVLVEPSGAAGRPSRGRVR